MAWVASGIFNSANSCYLKSLTTNSWPWNKCCVVTMLDKVQLQNNNLTSERLSRLFPSPLYTSFLTCLVLSLLLLAHQRGYAIFQHKLTDKWNSLSVSLLSGAGRVTGASAGAAQAIQPAICFCPWHRNAHLYKTLLVRAAVCDLGGSLLSPWAWVGWSVCAGSAGSVSYQLVWCHGQSAVWEHAISWLSGLLQMASQEILFRSGTGK